MTGGCLLKVNPWVLRFSRLCPLGRAGPYCRKESESCRFNAVFARLAHIEVLVVCIYGFANRCDRQYTDILLAAAFSLFEECGLPCIIAGDFNAPVQDFPSFDLFRNEGFAEMFSL